MSPFNTPSDEPQLCEFNITSRLVLASNIGSVTATLKFEFEINLKRECRKAARGLVLMSEKERIYTFNRCWGPLHIRSIVGVFGEEFDYTHLGIHSHAG